jgi:hypothetical protein
MWSRKHIAASSIINSSANLFVPFALAWSYGIEYPAIWLSFRAFVQIIIAATPNPISALIYLEPRPKRYVGIISFGYFLGGVGVLVSVCLYYFFAGKIVALSVGEKTAFLIFSLCFLFSSYESLVCRFRERSDFLLKASLLDLFFTLSAILSTFFFSFLLFASLYCFKEFIKGAFLLYNRSKSEDVNSVFSVHVEYGKVIRYATSHAMRGGMQTLSQYGDRFIWPVLFGFEMAGKIVLGSSLGMLIAVLSSSAFAWSIPKVLKGEDIIDWLKDEWEKLISLSLILSFLVFLFFEFLFQFFNIGNKEDYNSAAISIGLMFSSVNSANILSIVAKPSRLRGYLYTLRYFCYLFISYLAVWLSVKAGFDYKIAILAGVGFSLFSYHSINGFDRFSLKSFMNVCLFLSVSSMILAVSYV